MFHIFFIIRKPVLYWQSHGNTQGTAAGNNAHLVDRVGSREEFGYQGMTDLVVRGVALLFLTHDHTFALGTHEYLIFGKLQVGHLYLVLVLPRCK